MSSERERQFDLLAQHKGRCIALPEVEPWVRMHFNDVLEVDCVACREARHQGPIGYTLDDVLFVDVPYGRVRMTIVADLTEPDGSFYYHVYAGCCSECGVLHWTHGENRSAALDVYFKSDTYKRQLEREMLGLKVHIVHVDDGSVE